MPRQSSPRGFTCGGWPTADGYSERFSSLLLAATKPYNVPQLADRPFACDVGIGGAKDKFGGDVARKKRENVEFGPTVSEYEAGAGHVIDVARTLGDDPRRKQADW